MAPLNANEAGVHADMAKHLPKIIRIQSKIKHMYLQFYQEYPILPNALRYATGKTLNVETTFEVEPSTTQTGLIHIRCLENNMYLADYGTGNNWIAAMAIKPEENQSDKHCTLFQPIFLNSENNRVLRLRHVHSGKYVKLARGSGYNYGLLAITFVDNYDENNDTSVCTFVDWESVVRHARMAKRLPKIVIIQTNENDRYLHFYKEHPALLNALRYVGDNTLGLKTRFEVELSTAETGLVHVRCLENNKYLSNYGTGNNWIAAMADTPLEDPSEKYCTLFQPIFLDSENNRVLRLRHVHTGNYVMFFHGSGNYYGMLAMGNLDNDTTVCTFVDWKTVFPNVIRSKDDVDAVTAQTLPKFVIIQSNKNNKYLHLYTGFPEVPNALRFDGDYTFDLETRFEVVPATSDTSFIHIRSVQNNKYWANFGTDNNWVAAIADKPEEDQSDGHCTVFQPFSFDSGNKRVRGLRHVHTGSYISSFHSSGGRSDGLLYLSSDNSYDMCTFIDWKSVVMLPDRIRIKGDNEKYLKAYKDGLMDYRHEADNSSFFDFDVFPSRDGGIRLKSAKFNRYWTCNDHSPWVWLELPKSEVHETKTVFIPTVLVDKRIILKCLANGKFCDRIEIPGSTMESRLSACRKYPDDIVSKMTIVEPIISRTIENVRYHFTAAKRYNEKTSALIDGNTGHRGEGLLTAELNLKTTVTNTTNWSTSVSATTGHAGGFTVGIPEVLSFGFEASSEVTSSEKLGETVKRSIEVGSVKTLTVPCGVRMKATLMATRVSYDIPFSYTQRDVLVDGTIKVTEKKDGIFTGENGYDYRYEVVEIPISPAPTQ